MARKAAIKRKLQTGAVKHPGAIFAAILFVLVVSAVEIGNSDRLGSLGPQEQGIPKRADDEPVAVAPAEPDCSQMESEFAVTLSESRQCNVDADCTLAQFQCPFECVASVRATLVEQLKRDEATYQQSCNWCESECSQQLYKWRAACVRQRCILLDRSHDELEDATLELLNRPADDRI